MRVEQIGSDGLEQAVRLSGLRVVTLASPVFEITNDSRRRALGLVSHFTSDWSLREAALRFEMQSGAGSIVPSPPLQLISYCY
jgi:hypothetical protein